MAFDTRVHIKDSKTGATRRVQPYKLKIQKNSEPIYLRDGKRWDATGKVVGEMSVEERKHGLLKPYEVVQAGTVSSLELENQIRAELEAEYAEKLTLQAEQLKSAASEVAETRKEVAAMDALQKLESQAGRRIAPKTASAEKVGGSV